MEFRDAAGGGEDPTPPVCRVQVDGEQITTRLETDDDLFRFHWRLDAAAHATHDVRIDASFPWTQADCADPAYHLEWRTLGDSTFDVMGARREVSFRFDPEVSVLAVGAQEGEFERGVVRLPVPRWGEYGIWFDPNLSDLHIDEFQGKCRFPLGPELGYLRVGDRDCELGDLDQAQVVHHDSMTVEARAEVEDMRDSARLALESISRRHSISPLDTTSSLEVVRDQLGLRDAALPGLNSVERWNLRYAVALLWALDPRLKPSEVIARMDAAGEAAGER